jgi:hypothetical protein
MPVNRLQVQYGREHRTVVTIAQSDSPRLQRIAALCGRTHVLRGLHQCQRMVFSSISRLALQGHSPYASGVGHTLIAAVRG